MWTISRIFVSRYERESAMVSSADQERRQVEVNEAKRSEGETKSCGLRLLCAEIFSTGRVSRLFKTL